MINLKTQRINGALPPTLLAALVLPALGASSGVTLTILHP
jgi:hypothetical protein